MTDYHDLLVLGIIMLGVLWILYAIGPSPGFDDE